jgi:hypothetical protein
MVWLLVLIVLSTSTTAYVALCAIAVPIAASMALSLSWDRLTTKDLLLASAAVIGLTTILAVYFLMPSRLDPMITLLQDTVINKANTQSGMERGYWNIMSLEAFYQSSGLGIGIGTSRASSWPIAVLAQLGIIGSILLGILLFMLLRGLSGMKPLQRAGEIVTVSNAARAAGIASMVAASLISGFADPGAVFFISLAVVVSSRAVLSAGVPGAIDSILPANTGGGLQEARAG